MNKKNSKRCHFVIVYLIIPLFLFSQKETHSWYFGNQAALDFNNIVAGYPLATTNSVMNAHEGSSSISDKNTGQLLFYTNGVNIWDASHNVMMNGTNLWGRESSTQAALIIPEPGTCNRYYIFTTPHQGSLVDTVIAPFAYSIVDMNLNNGLGAVIQKNTLLLDSVSEKLAAVKHANGCDIWVLTHKMGSADFYAYLLSYGGIIDTVISTVGDTTLAGTYNTSNGLTQGNLKFSPDGSKLVHAYYNNLVFPPPYDTVASTQLFDFNTASGVVSNPYDLDVYFGYGASFSPNSSLLYMSGMKMGLGPSTLIQYDLNAPDINASRIDIVDPNLDGAVTYDLQLAIDGKIYVVYSSAQDTLGVINNPNTIGVGCNYVRKGIYLSGKKTRIGLPDFIESYFDPNYTPPSYLVQPAFSLNNFCFGDTTYFTDLSIITQSCFAPISWNWTFGDPATGSADTSYLQSPKHLYSNPGTYTVTLRVQNECVIDSFSTNVVVPPAITSSQSPSICIGNSIVVGTNSYNTSGTYIDTLSNANGCDSIVTTNLTVSSAIINNTSDSICEGDSILLGGSFQTQAGVYTDTIDLGGCDSIISTSLKVNQAADATITPAGNFCSGDPSLILQAQQSGGNWSGNGITNSSTGEFSPALSGAGTHQIIYTISGNCGDADTTDIIVEASPAASLFTTDDNCEERKGSISIETFSGSPPYSYQWNTGSTDSLLLNLLSGNYTVILSDNTGCSSTYLATINDYGFNCKYLIYVPSAFSPNEDGDNDMLYVKGHGIQNIQFVIYNRWGNKVFETSTMTEGWDGTYKGKQLNSAVFSYYLHVTFTNGETAERKGTVSIMN